MRPIEEVREWVVEQGKTAHGIFIHELIAFIDSEAVCTHRNVRLWANGWFLNYGPGNVQVKFCPDCGMKLEFRVIT